MRILLTGATSFSGMWFARVLSAQGHHVVAPLRSRDYHGLRRARLAQIEGCCETPSDAPFGSKSFLDIVADRGPFDTLCHHAAVVENYKSPDFDALGAAAQNSYSLDQTLELLGRNGCRQIVLTGSVFEAGEGEGSDPGHAISPYGLSKTLTSEIFQFYARRHGIALRKFVIANPFGPYEEARFTTYLVRCWKAGKIAQVNTPAYVRDNIHVSLLAEVYGRFVGGPFSNMKINPSFYVESQGVFARRFADEIGRRLNLPGLLECAEQLEFPEPRILANGDPVHGEAYGWSEEGAWDALAAFYAGPDFA